VALPRLGKEKMELLDAQLKESGILSKHEISYWSTEKVEELYEREDFQFDKMGNDYKQDKDYFITCGLSAFLALS
jgi:hypothetical protein